MPNENIQRAVKKVSEKGEAQLEEFVIEAIWTGARLPSPATQAVGGQGVALRIKGVTDNKNRTISEIKKILSTHEAKMIQPGSIGWMFNTSVQVSDQTQQNLAKLFGVLNDNPDVIDIISNLN